MSFSARKFLVTGSAGFIGFHLAKRLLEEGHAVVGIDLLTENYDVEIKKRRNNVLSKYSEFCFYKLDITNKELVEALFLRHAFHQVLHFAGHPGVRSSIADPQSYEKSNCLGSLNIFESAFRNNIERVVYASSSAVYGNSNRIPYSESDSTNSQASFYGITKKFIELMARYYFDVHCLSSIGLRLFTVYGEYGRPDMAPFKFVKQALQKRSIDVYNFGDMKRGFTNIEDVVEGIMLSVAKENVGCEIYNLGGENYTTLMEFIEIVKKLVGFDVRLNFMDMQKGEMYESSADISKAKKELGYFPRVSLEVGMARFVRWFQNNEQWVMRLKENNH